MKYIIEIDSKILEDAKAGYVRLGEIADAVKTTATPYNPTGDCISREALRKTICGMDFDFGDYYDHTDEIINRICEKIDNAQSVEAFTKEDMAGAYNEGYACGGRESKRPQGDLISREALKEHKVYSEERHEYVVPVYNIDNAQAVDLWQMRQEATENALKKQKCYTADRKVSG